MSIAVHISTAASLGGNDEARDELFDDTEAPVYWTLVPMFRQIEQKTGLLIDQYGTVVFPSGQIPALLKTLADARKDFSSRPVGWPVSMGTEVRPAYRELTGLVSRTDVLTMLERLERLAKEAFESSSSLWFVGD